MLRDYFLDAFDSVVLLLSQQNISSSIDLHVGRRCYRDRPVNHLAHLCAWSLVTFPYTLASFSAAAVVSVTFFRFCFVRNRCKQSQNLHVSSVQNRTQVHLIPSFQKPYCHSSLEFGWVNASAADRVIVFVLLFIILFPWFSHCICYVWWEFVHCCIIHFLEYWLNVLQSTRAAE